MYILCVCVLKACSIFRKNAVDVLRKPCTAFTKHRLKCQVSVERSCRKMLIAVFIQTQFTMITLRHNLHDLIIFLSYYNFSTKRMVGHCGLVYIFCSDFFSTGNPQPSRGDIKNLFHSELPIDTFYPLVSEFRENIEKWLVIKTIWREKFGRNDSQQRTH